MATATNTCVTIEVDGPRNESLVFRPLLGQRIRGRYDLRRVAEPEAGRLLQKWPEPVPGQRLRLSPGVEGKNRNDTGKLSVIEPLHDDEFAKTRDRILATGQAIPPKEVVHDVEISSALHYMKRAVDAGLARVIEGELPATLKHKPRTQYHFQEPEAKEDKIEEAIGRMTDLVAGVVDSVAKQSQAIAQQSQAQTAALTAALEKLASR